MSKTVKLGGTEYELVGFGIGNHHALHEAGALMLVPKPKPKKPKKNIVVDGYKYRLVTSLTITEGDKE